MKSAQKHATVTVKWTFEAEAAQPERQLTASGALLLHPEHQEVHLERMTLTTRGQQWQLAPASSATIRYGRGQTTVENARLVSGDQSIEAEGTFGRPGDALRISMNNVDVANVDALLLREPQFTGRLNASGTIAGTPDALRGEAEFTVARGGFRQFRYDSFSGTAAYNRPRHHRRHQASAESHAVADREGVRPGHRLREVNRHRGG
jgi:autotransporter translocation and assembly factor TamB